MKRGLKIIPIASVDDVLRTALTKPLTPIEWAEPAEVEAVKPQPAGTEHGVVTH